MNRCTETAYAALLILAALLPAGCTAQTEHPVDLPETATPAMKLKVPSRDLFTRQEDLRPVFFASGESQLNPGSMQMLKENVDWLKRHMPLHILVAGYSDGQGTPEQNLIIGERRADALRDFYVAMGIPRSRISTISYGQEEPLCFEQTAECQAQNRRADTMVENKDLALR